MTNLNFNYDLSGVEEVALGTPVEFLLYCTLEGKSTRVPLDEITCLLWYDDPTRGRIEVQGIPTNSSEPGAVLLTFYPSTVGTYHLKISRFRAQIFKNKDIIVKVSGIVNTVSVELEFEMEQKNLLHLRVGKEVRFPIIIRDSNKNKVDIDHNLFEVLVTGLGKKIKAERYHEGLGYYIATFMPNAAGIYNVKVSYDGKEVIKEKLVVSEVTVARFSRIENVQDTISVGKPAAFTIVSCDMKTQKVDAGGDFWEVRVTGSAVKQSNPTVNIVDNKNGTYTVNYTVYEPTQYTISVKLGDENAKKSPFKVNAK